MRRGALVFMALGVALSALAPTSAADVKTVESDFADTTQSLELVSGARIYAEPNKRADRLGKIARGTRVEWVSLASGKDCRTGWVQIKPRGWVCSRYRQSPEPPSTEILPVLPDGLIVPGVFGRVRVRNPDVVVYDSRQDLIDGNGHPPAQKMDVRRKGIKRHNGKRYWRTHRGQYVESKFIRQFAPSTYVGVVPGQDGVPQLPLGWARGWDHRAPVPVYASASEDAEVVRELPTKSMVFVLEHSDDDQWVRIGDGEWLPRSEIRIARATEPPDEVEGDETWIDLDLDEQVVVVYRGSEPVYTTMISSGIRKRRTPRGVYRIEKKVSEATMNSFEHSEDKYSVAKVPWVMYISKFYALHGAYWHDGFGGKRSHGCINIAPRDARAIYNLLGPEVPAGWRVTYATEDNPGSVVQIRGTRKGKRKRPKKKKK